MVEHIDRLTFGPSLNESENPVNNFFSPCPLLFTGPEELFSFFPAGEGGEAIQRKKEKPSQTPKLGRFPDPSIYFTFPSGKELESGWTAQISSLKRGSSSLITSSSGQPFGSRGLEEALVRGSESF